MLEGGGYPKLCGSCSESHWEERASGFEDAWCGKYDNFCSLAIKECDRIPFMSCVNCPRHMD